MKRFFLIAMLWAAPVMAVEPGEQLRDAGLEERARDLSKELRCLVCRNENIDESNADLARDMRIAVRERLVAGDDDTQVIAFLVERYGEYVLLRPQTNGVNVILWVSGPLLFLMALGIAYVSVRRRLPASGPATGDDGLTQDEAAQLAEILRQ